MNIIKTKVNIKMKDYWKALNYLSLEKVENIKEEDLAAFNFTFEDNTTGAIEIYKGDENILCSYYLWIEGKDEVSVESDDGIPREKDIVVDGITYRISINLVDSEVETKFNDVAVIKDVELDTRLADSIHKVNFEDGLEAQIEDAYKNILSGFGIELVEMNDYEPIKEIFEIILKKADEFGINYNTIFKN